MIRLSPEQILAELKQNGTYDAMRHEMLKAFKESEHGRELEKHVASLVERFTDDGDSMPRSRKAEEDLERRVYGYLERYGRLEKLEKDARNYWLKRDKKDSVKRSISTAIDNVCKPDYKPSQSQSRVVSRELELDPPRIPGHGSGTASSRSHNYYRRGDAAAAFVPICDPLLASSPGYTCISVEVASCDGPKNMYMVSDPDAATQGPLQDTWAVYWDQLIALKRPYDQKYRDGDQVYALYRMDLDTDTAVSTEFFPGRVERVSHMSLAIRFDTGELAHVYYDEVFAAGRVGFLRQQSEERKRRGASDAMVRVQGRVIPSFTGFWPDIAQPGLGKYDRKARYRQMPPLLVDTQAADRYYMQHQLPNTCKESPRAAEESDRNSDMDIESSSASPEPSAPKASAHAQDREALAQSVSVSSTQLEQKNGQTAPPKKPAHPTSSEEDGEIDVEPKEEGEYMEEVLPAASPRDRYSSSNSSRRQSDYHSRPARRQSPYGRADYHRLNRHDRPSSRGRPSRFDDRDRSPYRSRRDEWDTYHSRSSGYRDGGYRGRQRSRSRSRSHSRVHSRAGMYASPQSHLSQRAVPNGRSPSPPQQQQQQQQIIINPFQPVHFDSGLEPTVPQDCTDARDFSYQQPYPPRPPGRSRGDYHY
ncbi:hypothetical protein H4217_003069 [Coemansia sp. RSA 1939]|nr:hypothetical protein H4217_003069 [Coemansia sp. RSA 1939]